MKKFTFFIMIFALTLVNYQPIVKAETSSTSVNKVKYNLNFHNYIRNKIIETANYSDYFLDTHHITYHISLNRNMDIQDISCEKTVMPAVDNAYEIEDATEKYILERGCLREANLLYNTLNLKQFKPDYLNWDPVFKSMNFSISLVPAEQLKRGISEELIEELSAYYAGDTDYDYCVLEINFKRQLSGWKFVSLRTIDSSSNEQFNMLAKTAVKRENVSLQTYHGCWGGTVYLEDSALGENLSIQLLFKGNNIYYKN